MDNWTTLDNWITLDTIFPHLSSSFIIFPPYSSHRRPHLRPEKAQTRPPTLWALTGAEWSGYVRMVSPARLEMLCRYAVMPSTPFFGVQKWHCGIAALILFGFKMFQSSLHPAFILFPAKHAHAHVSAHEMKPNQIKPSRTTTAQIVIQHTFSPKVEYATRRKTANAVLASFYFCGTYSGPLFHLLWRL